MGRVVNAVEQAALGWEGSKLRRADAGGAGPGGKQTAYPVTRPHNKRKLQREYETYGKANAAPA